MVSPGVAPFAHSGVEGMELAHGGPTFGQLPVDPNLPREGLAGGDGMFRTGSDVAGGFSGRVESRAKARERARERAKEKLYTGRDPLEREPASGRGYAPSSAHAPYANLPSQVSSALQHPFQAPFPAAGINQRQTAYHASSYNFPEPFSSTAFGGYAPPSYAHPEPSPSLPSVSHYFVENPPGAMGASRYPTGSANPNFSGFAPGPPAASSSRASSFSSLLNEPQYSGFPSQGYNFPPAYSSQPRPQSSLLGQSPGSRLSHASTVYPPPPSHLVRPGHDRQHPIPSTTPHSLDPNFYNPQRLPGFEELEEFKP